MYCAAIGRSGILNKRYLVAMCVFHQADRVLCRTVVFTKQFFKLFFLHTNTFCVYTFQAGCFNTSEK